MYDGKVTKHGWNMDIIYIYICHAFITEVVSGHRENATCAHWPIELKDFPTIGPSRLRGFLACLMTPEGRMNLAKTMP